LKTIDKKIKILYFILLIVVLGIIGFYLFKDKIDISQKQSNKIEITEEKENYEILVTGGFNMYANLSYAVPLLKFNLTDSLPNLEIGYEKTIQLTKYDSVIPSLVQLSKRLNDNLNSKNNKPYHFYNPYLRTSESIDLIKTTKEKTERKQISGHRFTNEKNITYLELDSIDSKISYLLHNYLISVAEKESKDTISTNGLREEFSLANALKNPENVYKLNLRRKRIGSIPPEISKLKNLEVLIISGSTIKSLPKEIENCKKLKSIIANSSKLEELPSSLGNLKNLRTLKVGNCNLKSIPKEIGNIKSLWELSIGHNKLTTLPNELAKLENLTWLDISNNQIKEFPSCIIQMENLKRFWMFGNNINKLPFEINKLKYLSHIRLNKEKIENIDSLENIMPEIMFLHKD
jgi:Leucine-rich repeat (LRR) protein